MISGINHHNGWCGGGQKLRIHGRNLLPTYIEGQDHRTRHLADVEVMVDGVKCEIERWNHIGDHHIICKTGPKVDANGNFKDADGKCITSAGTHYYGQFGVWREYHNNLQRKYYDDWYDNYALRENKHRHSLQLQWESPRNYYHKHKDVHYKTW